MAINLSNESRLDLVKSIKRFFRERLDQDIGDLKADLVLDFAMREIGPTIYNQALRDAQAWLGERLEDLEASCHKAEMGYWS